MIHRDLKPGTELRYQYQPGVWMPCWLVRTRARTALVGSDPGRRAGYYEWSLPLAQLRLPTEDEIDAANLEVRRREVIAVAVRLIERIRTADAEELEWLAGPLASLEAS